MSNDPPLSFYCIAIENECGKIADVGKGRCVASCEPIVDIPLRLNNINPCACACVRVLCVQINTKKMENQGV
jgi:hypothetical protein